MILRRWLRREEKEANLERELSFHIEERVAGMVRSGVRVGPPVHSAS